MLLGIHIQNFGVLHDTIFGLAFDELVRQPVKQVDDLFKADRPGVPDDRLPISQIGVLIGRNSTGKTAFFNALSFLSDCMRHDVPFASDQNGRGGFTKLRTKGNDSDIRFDMLFQDLEEHAFLGYEIVLSSQSHGRPRVSKESVRRAVYRDGQFEVQTIFDLRQGQGTVLNGDTLRTAGVADTKAPALKVYGLLLDYPSLGLIHRQMTRWFFGSFGNRQTTEAPAGSQRHLSVTGDNVNNVLAYYRKEHPQQYASIVDRISDRLPDEKKIDEAFRNGSASSGLKKLYTILLLLEDPNPRSLVCLEEPDGGLYHDMVDTLSLAIRDYALQNPDCQVFFTTHSQYILESMRPEEVWVFERRREQSPAIPQGLYTHTRCVARDAIVRAMHAEGVGMGALWYSGHLDSSWEDLHASGSTD